MIVVADTSPLNYLIQIESDQLLPQIYKRILVPSAVISELSHPDAPAKVSAWLRHLPAWLEILDSSIPPGSDLAFLDPGERQAIQLAREIKADLLLIDERKGRLEAQRRGLVTTGTLGVLLRAAALGLLDPVHAYRTLISGTTFRTSTRLESQFMEAAATLLGNSLFSLSAELPKTNRNLPRIIVHCDWSKSPNRRWMAKAVLADGRYIAEPPQLVGELDTFLDRVRDRQFPKSSTIIGFDFPIGLPRAYADKAVIKNFLSFLSSLQPNAPFFEVCRLAPEISIERPFYPHAPGDTQRNHLTEALGIAFEHLLRTCDQATEDRDEASALFWTLGAKQVGKAAIVGWRDILIPALTDEEIKVWPFHGELNSLLQSSPVVLAETYPTQYYKGIFGALNGSKGDQEVRLERAQRILAWTDSKSQHLQLSPELRSEIKAGFNNGDDAFDAAIGLFGMIDALHTWSPASEPTNPTIRSIEGWILGQPIPPNPA